MSERTRDYLVLGLLFIAMLLIVWHYYPTLIAVETGRGLPP